MAFFAVRFICTHIIAYRHPIGIIWPDTSFYSISNTNMDDIQYQVSSYTGVLALAVIYWAQENKKVMTYVSMTCLAICILLELSFRISYCTGTSC